MAVIDTGVFGNCIGYETIAVSNTALGLTPAKYTRVANFGNGSARVALVTVIGTAGTNDIRFTFDGTAPVALTTGHVLAAANDTLIIRGLGNITNFKMIRDGSDTNVTVSYFQ
jgi:hypothetical protein